MGDLEKVIRGWERCKKRTCPSIFSNEYRDCEYTMGLYCRQDILIDETIELLKGQEAKEPQWTSVEDGYPDKEGFYLVSDSKGQFHPWVAEMRVFCAGIKGFLNGANMPVVGAWMPLPEPYKEVK